MGSCCSQNHTDQQQRTELKYENQELEKSAVQIQRVFRGHKARSQMDEKRKLQEHGPTTQTAIPAPAWPGTEYLPQMVRDTIGKLGEFKIKTNIQGDNTDQSVKLEPFRFVDPTNKYLHNSIYMGEWVKGMRWGKGKQIWQDGSYYVGQFVNNMANGKGRLIHADGDCYEGDWVDDKANGYGKYYHTNGANYVGEWLNDQQHGKGQEEWQDGAQYIGDYQFGLKHGIGRFQWQDGSFYEGEFQHNNIHGKGIYQWPDGRKYDGEWQNNKMHGYGVFTWADQGGQKYEGNYIEDQREGFGVFYWPDGRVYSGMWRQGKQNGEGKIKDINGNESEGYWENGKRMDMPANLQRQPVDPNQNYMEPIKTLHEKDDDINRSNKPNDPNNHPLFQDVQIPDYTPQDINFNVDQQQNQEPNFA